MKTYIAHLEAQTPYSQSRNKDMDFPKLKNETPDDYEKRTWKERVHVTPSGEVFIPPMTIKNGLSEAAAFLGLKFKGQKTYKGFFEAGIIVVNPVLLGIKKDDVNGEWLFLPSDGKRGGGKRVWKCYPVIPKWEGDAEIVVIHEAINKEILEQHLETFGNYVGIGRFRPRNNGYYGRFTVKSLKEK